MDRCLGSFGYRTHRTDVPPSPPQGRDLYLNPVLHKRVRDRLASGQRILCMGACGTRGPEFPSPIAGELRRGLITTRRWDRCLRDLDVKIPSFRARRCPPPDWGIWLPKEAGSFDPKAPPLWGLVAPHVGTSRAPKDQNRSETPLEARAPPSSNLAGWPAHLCLMLFALGFMVSPGEHDRALARQSPEKPALPCPAGG